MSPNAAKQEAVRVTLVGMYLDLVLGAAKITAGLLSNSFALIVDGIRSLSDAGTDIFVIVVARFSRDAPEVEQPYGHGRFEALATVILGMVLFAVAGIILFDGLQRLTAGKLPIPAWSGLVVAAVSVGSKEWIYHYTLRSASRLNSSLLKANAWHSRRDAISSVAVLIGIFGARQGLPWLDVVAAIFVALIIARSGFSLGLDSLTELVDTAIPRDRQAEIQRSMLAIPGVHQVKTLRSRRSGGSVLLEGQILVDPRMSVAEGHQLGEAVRHRLIKRFEDINDVIIRIDPEPHDPEAPPHDPAPLREEVLANIHRCWKEILTPDDIDHIDLHYLNNGIDVDLQLSATVNAIPVGPRLADALRPLGYINRLSIFRPVFSQEIKTEHP